MENIELHVMLHKLAFWEHGMTAITVNEVLNIIAELH